MSTREEFGEWLQKRREFESAWARALSKALRSSMPFAKGISRIKGLGADRRSKDRLGLR